MNRIITSLVLIVSGVVISFLTGNIIVSIVGCSFIGLVLNRELFSSGKRDISEIGVYPNEYLNRFRALKDHVSVHDYDYVIYEDTVQDSIFIDTDGKVWSLGLETLDWYKLIGDDWIGEEPTNKMILVSETEFMEMEIP